VPPQMPEPVEPAIPVLADAAPPATAKGEATVEELTRAQAQHARRVAESRATVPDLTLTTQVDMEAAVALRAGLPAPVPTFEDLVVKACGLALREAPRANGAYRDARFERYARVNVGVTMAAQGTTVVPVVFDADAKSLAEIAADTSGLAKRAREGAITQPELSGGTFTLSSLAEFGVTHFAAVVHQPQAAMLAMGAVEQRAVVRDGAVVARHVVDVTLACDHRILHGPDAARLLRRIRELLEQPALLTR
jgi:pyruvate dehydrogenase E2 component (dihydrolipoamide acetyltransferase)